MDIEVSRPDDADNDYEDSKNFDALPTRRDPVARSRFESGQALEIHLSGPSGLKPCNTVLHLALLIDSDLSFPRCRLECGMVAFSLICVGQRKFAHRFVELIT
jgi:hypothetical protein